MGKWWEANADLVEKVYGGFVDYEERFYICPNCDEPVYECDWSERDCENFVCPVCEWGEGD